MIITEREKWASTFGSQSNDRIVCKQGAILSTIALKMNIILPRQRIFEFIKDLRLEELLRGVVENCSGLDVQNSIFHLHQQ